MATSTIAWFIVTFVLFVAFVGWVWHEIRAVGHRQISKKDPFEAAHD